MAFDYVGEISQFLRDRPTEIYWVHGVSLMLCQRRTKTTALAGEKVPQFDSKRPVNQRFPINLLTNSRARVRRFC